MPRSADSHADRLANQAMEAATGKPATAERPAATAAAGTDPGPDRGPAFGWASAQQQATTTLLLRHGQTALSIERRFAGRGNFPLTEAGRRQANAAARRLAARGGIDLIVTSPLQRALRTAEAVAAATGAPLSVADDLIETDFGDWEGLSFAEAAARWPERLDAWLGSADVAPPGGESFAATARRVLTVTDRLLAEHQYRTLLLVSHVTPIKTLACRALLAPLAALFRMQLDVASLCEIAWFTDGPAVVKSLNDTAHLRQDGL